MTAKDSISIRALEPGDAEAYFALRAEMLASTPLSFSASPGDDFANDVEGVRARLAGAPDNVILGAFGPEDASGASRETLVGAVGVVRMGRRKTAHAVHLWGVYVRPAVRRRGVGRRLMEAALAHARTLEGVCVARLGVSSEAPGARALYESVGFRAWGVEERALFVDGAFRDEVHMTLFLDEGAVHR